MKEKRDWLSAAEATALLDVKLATLYSYVSRGLVQSVPARSARGRLYARADLQRLRARHEARSGHAAVAAGALRWGEPTLETQISDIRADGPYYRGVSALSLLTSAASFECAAELIWTGVLPTGVRWPLERRRARRAERRRPITIGAMAAELAQLALDDGQARDSHAAELSRARWLLMRLVDANAQTTGERVIAKGLLRTLEVASSELAVERLDRALILCIDHELNASTFTARVAASAGAELFACVAAGLHTLSGAVHGGVSALVESVIDEVLRTKSAKRVVRAALTRGQHLPGFGHPLYPLGDPRCRALFTLADLGGRSTRRLDALRELVTAMQAERQLHPNLDMGLVALCSALELPRGSPSTVFAIGRIAGFVAHILEQRAQGYLLRPRARYVGG